MGRLGETTEPLCYYAAEGDDILPMNLIDNGSALTGDITVDKQSGTVVTLNTSEKYVDKPIQLNVDVVKGEAAIEGKVITDQIVDIRLNENTGSISGEYYIVFPVEAKVTKNGYIDSVDNTTMTVYGTGNFQLNTLSDTTYTPSTTDQVISAKAYLTGDQTISGDANLVAANIKSGTSIFGVSGTYTSDATATSSDIIAGKSAYVNGVKVDGAIEIATMAEVKSYLGIA